MFDSVFPKQIFYDDSGVLSVEGNKLHDGLGLQTPFYCYSAQCIKERFLEYKKYFSDAFICYAVKANPNLAILRMLVGLGAGVDVVSAGEIHRATIVKAKNIVFSGVGKTEEELRLALKVGVYQINVESLSELVLLQSIAKQLGVVVDVAFRINPKIDSKTGNDMITTGRTKDKFGILEADIPDLLNNLDVNTINLVGISVHIGSNMRDISPVKNLCSYILGLSVRLKEMGVEISRLDLGGGIGIRYTAADDLIELEEYACVINQLVSSLSCKLILEPGRYIVGEAGILITMVEHIKTSVNGGKFVIVDAAMSDFIRTALYPDAVHQIIPIIASDITENCTVAGPICESSDIFARDIMLPADLKRGDLLAICTVGAYGASMMNNYNSKLFPAEVLINGRKCEIVRKRQTYEDLLACEVINKSSA